MKKRLWFFFKCRLSPVTCHLSLSYLTCHLSYTPTATYTDHPPTNSPTMHGKLFCKDPEIWNKVTTPKIITGKTAKFNGMPILAIRSTTRSLQSKPFCQHASMQPTISATLNVRAWTKNIKWFILLSLDHKELLEEGVLLRRLVRVHAKHFQFLGCLNVHKINYWLANIIKEND